MNHKELFIGVSTVTAASFFSSIAGVNSRCMQTPPHLPDFHKSEIKSEYKSQLYKLWQYVAKNKPSLCNDEMLYSGGKKHSQLQCLFTTHQYSSEKFQRLENCTKQSISRTSQNWFSCGKIFFFRKYKNNNIDWRNVPCFILQICLIYWMFSYVKNILKRGYIYNCNGYFELKNLIPQIYRKATEQSCKKSHGIDVCINKNFHHKVCIL
ncbi:hypothetical protein [Bartonella florencae]|uniref:hypothetical protein n=1 Tax=Bartonella florencae TaxID=928210 RepID=UPI0002D99F85|nr:hypothetical protein [Bartonella florencae]